MSKHPAPDQSFEAVFSECATADVCIWKALTVACSELHVQAGTMFKVNEANSSLEVLNTVGILPWRVAQGHFPITQGICGWVSQHKEPVLVNDVSKDARFNKQIDLVTQFKTVSVLCVPVLVEGRSFGVLELINRQDHPFSQSDLALLQEIVASAVQRLKQLA